MKIIETANTAGLVADLAIVIVSWNTRELTRQCLASLCATSTPPAERDGEMGLAFGPCRTQVCVVDNASSDGSVQMLREQFPWVHLIENGENAGFARANNQAIRATRSRYVLLLNSDTRVHPGALEVLAAYMEAHPQAGGCGAHLLNADGSLQPSAQPMLTPWREFWRLAFLDGLVRQATYGAAVWKARTPQRVDVIKGACFMLRRAALDQVGVLDESYFMYTEEVDLCYRLAQAGWELWWLPGALVTHYGEASSRQAALKMYVQLYRSKVQFYRKFGGARRAENFKHLVRLAYWPRLIVATALAPAVPSYDAPAQTFRCLLSELADM